MHTPYTSSDLAPFANWVQWDACESESTQHVFQPYASAPVHSTPALQEEVDARTQNEPSADSADAGGLRLLQYSEWDPEKDYKLDPPTCIRYKILWRVTVSWEEKRWRTTQNKMS